MYFPPLKLLRTLYQMSLFTIIIYNQKLKVLQNNGVGKFPTPNIY